jgi:hypothetical protein
MALLNLYKVTKTLTDLLKENITRNIDTSLPSTFDVTAIPPEQVENAENRLNFFLYHIAEDAYYKNALGPGSDVPNVAKTPMALNLFYILTAHHEGAEEAQFDAETQQKLMGYGLKTFHDFPVITDQTQIDGTQVLDAELRGKDNSLEVILRPVSAEDSVAFWGSEDTRTVRLSAYYEVRVVLLEPELPQTMPGIVLNLGMYLVQVGSPHLAGSQSLIRFQLPTRNGGAVQQVEASPARVTLDNSPNPPEAHNRFQLLGTNLTVGKSRSLVLKNGIWAKLPPPNGPIEQTVINLVQNPDWQVGFITDRVEVKLAPTLTHVKADGTTVNLSVLPGFYSVFVRSVLEEKVISNDLKQIVATSNEIGFAVAPRIVGHTAPDANGNIQIALGGEFDPLNPNLPVDAIQVVVAGEVYEPVLADPPANSREFFVTNTPSDLIRIKPPFPVVVSEQIAYPFRLIVNGAESAPFWIELNP